jgi:glutamate-1-semialdehyde 2,1-aminomutase
VKGLNIKRSRELYSLAKQVMAGGVSSPVRSFKGVGGEPLFISKGEGARVWDVDGNEFIDYVLSWGPLILGHSNKRVIASVIDAIRNGTSFGAPTEPELMLAQEICRSVKSIEKVRFVNSGTEATMSAIRIARAYTSRKKILKFEGCYHGHADVFLTMAGSGLATFGVPSSAGVPSEAVDSTLTLPYNDTQTLRSVLRDEKRNVAAVIIEPVAGNMGVIPSDYEFLRELRELCDSNDILLIFDEVITGFRVSKGGAQSIYGVQADITCLGKIIGGGFPVGAFGGSSELMSLLSPEGKVYQAGTLSGNPVAMAAGLATISLLDTQTYQTLDNISSFLQSSLEKAAVESNVDVKINRVGSMLGLFFTKDRVRNFQHVKRSNTSLYPRFHAIMLENGIYLPPSPYETIFVSTAHTKAEVERTGEAARRALSDLS